MLNQEEAKWRLCKLICLNNSQELIEQDLKAFLEIFDIDEELSISLKNAEIYCECCKLLNRYAFLFCKHYTGPASFILACFNCEHHNGEECTILDEIIAIEAKNLAFRDRHMLVRKPPSKN